MTTTRNTVADTVDHDYVLPTRGRTAGEVIVVGQSPLLPQLRRGAAVARELGRRFGVQADGLQVLLAELHDRLELLDAAIVEDSRAQLKGAVRELRSVVDWCDAVRRELADESALAESGAEPIDLAALAREVAARQPDPAVTVIAEGEVRWWGRGAETAAMLEVALELIAERTQATGTRAVEVGIGEGAPWIRVWGNGEPSDTVDPRTVERFRTAVEALGISVVPDQLGPGGAGLLLRLPRRD